MCTTSIAAMSVSSSRCSLWAPGSNDAATTRSSERPARPISPRVFLVRGSAWQPARSVVRHYGVTNREGGAMQVALHIEVIEPGAHVAITGRLGAATVADVRGMLADHLDRGTGDLVVDLQAVELVDATGLGVLVGTHRRADRVGRR